MLSQRFQPGSIRAMIRRSVTVMGKETVYWERNTHWPQTIVMLHGFRGNHMGFTDMVQHFFIASRRMDRLSGRLLIVSVSDKRRQELIERGARNLELMNPVVVTENYLSAFGTRLQGYAQNVRMPTLIIGGPHDRIVPLH